MNDSFSFSTDAFGSTGYPEESLRLIAGAGFTHVHWCHHWNDGFFYTKSEIDDIGRLLSDLHLKLLDCHGSTYEEKCWFSLRESERLAGMELVKNRVEFTAKLGGDALVMHVFYPSSLPNLEGENLRIFNARTQAIQTSLKELEDFCRDRKVRLALENGRSCDDYEKCLIPLIESRPKDYVGFCYDTGHHHMVVNPEADSDFNRKNKLRDRLAERLLVTHIHDNCGEADNHWTPFRGSVDWENVAGFLRLAHYKKPLNLELSFANSGRVNKAQFTRDAREALERLKKKVDS